ncbi:MAG TPA: lactonase family protein [Ktedonobacteraceae bacterium]
MISSQLGLYVGGYAPADQPGIHACTFDEATGTLAARDSFAGIVNPSYVLVHPNGRWLYAVSETSQQQDGAPGAVWALSCTREPWRMEPINHRASGGDWPCHLEINASGQWLLVSNYGSGTVSVFPILPDGALGEMTDLVQHKGSGPNPERQEGPHAHSATFTPDQRFVIVADLGIDALLVYAFDASTGQLHAHTRISSRSGAGPRFKAFHPGGQHLYVNHELDNTVVVYDYNAESGRLIERQIVETLPPGVTESAIAGIQISPQGDRLYVSNRGHDSISVFEIETDGMLVRLAIRPCGGRCPRNIAITPSSRYLLVANQESNEVVVLPVLSGVEAIGAPVGRIGASGPSSMHFVQA